MFEAFFLVLGLAFLFILAGIQAWYILVLGADEEAGLPRLLIRPLVVVATGAGFYLLYRRPELLPVALAIIFLPLGAVAAGRLLAERYWNGRERRRLIEEVGLWLEILERESGHGTARLVLGDRYRDLGEIEKARAFYREALEKSSDPERAKRELEDLDREIRPAAALSAGEGRAALRELAKWPLYLFYAVAGFLVLGLAVVLLVFLLRRSPLWVSFLATVMLPLYLLLRWLCR